MEGDREPDDTPTSRLVLTDEQLDRISRAIRDGLADEPPPDGLKLAREVIALVLGFGLLLVLYLVLTHWRPAVDLSVEANTLPPTEVLTHQDEEDGVDWQFGTAEARTLKVGQLRDTQSQTERFTISLPIPRAECFELAVALDTTCFGGVVGVKAPVTVSWNTPQVLQLAREITSDQADRPPSQLKLTLQQSDTSSEDTNADSADEPSEESETALAPPRLTIADGQPAKKQWCFTYQTSSAATLSVSGGSGGYQRPFEPDSAPDGDCGDGVQLRVTAGAATAQESDDSQNDSVTGTRDTSTAQPSDESRRASSVVTLAGISSLDVTTQSRRLNASALTGTLRLERDVSVFETATQAVFTGGEPIESRLEMEAGTPSLTITGGDVTGLETNRGNRVATVWDRNPDLMLPILLGLAGALTPLLGSAYRNGVYYLANRRSPEPDDSG